MVSSVRHEVARELGPPQMLGAQRGKVARLAEEAMVEEATEAVGEPAEEAEAEEAGEKVAQRRARSRAPGSTRRCEALRVRSGKR